MLWRHLAVIGVAAAILGVGSTSAAPTDSVQRARALERLLQAAAVNDEPAMWSALSRMSRLRLGPTLADFRSRGARGVHDGVAPYVRSSYRTILNVGFTWDRDLGLVAISGGSEHGAFAVPVRREHGMWKVEINPAVTVEAVRPLPGERVLKRTQLFAEIAALQMLDGAIMWFDGFPFEARTYWSRDQKHMSIWGEAPQPLRRGRHTVVAFAGTRREAAANAWTFTVSR